MTDDDLDVALRLLGTDLVVVARGHDDHAGTAQAWSRCRSTSLPATDDTPRLDALAPDDVTEAEARAATDDAITEWALAEAAGRFVLLHACGLSNSAGDVIALVGRSTAGKTTAALTLGQVFGYVSDEVVAVAIDGSVEAFPRPLGVVAGQWPATKTRQGPDQLGLVSCPDQLRLRRVVVLDRDDLGGEETAVTPLTLPEALLVVIPRISYLTALGRPLCRVTETLALTAPVRLTYAEIADTEDLLHRLLEQQPTEALEWSPEPATSDDESSVTWALRDGRVRRRPFVDAVQTPDQMVVLLDRTPVVLDGIGPTIWRAAGGAPTMAELLTAVEAEYGPHPNAASLVEQAVEDLTDNGVLGFHRPLPIDVLRAQPLSPAEAHDRG